MNNTDPAPKSATLRVNDGAIQLTYGTGPTTLLTVRGKDHELGYAELRELANAFDEAAKRAALHLAIGRLLGVATDMGDCDACGEPIAIGDLREVEAPGESLGPEVRRVHRACYDANKPRAGS